MSRCRILPGVNWDRARSAGNVVSVEGRSLSWTVRPIRVGVVASDRCRAALVSVLECSAGGFRAVMSAGSPKVRPSSVLLDTYLSVLPLRDPRGAVDASEAVSRPDPTTSRRVDQLAPLCGWQDGTDQDGCGDDPDELGHRTSFLLAPPP